MKPLPLFGAALLGGYLAWRRRRLGKVELVALAIVIAGLTAYGLGLIRLPNLEKAIERVGTTLGAWTYLLVGVMAFLETGAFVGLIAPGETLILVGGLVAGQGKISIVVLVALVWTAAVAGDLTSFVLGRRLGRGFMLRHGARFKITPERIEQVERFYARHGGKAVFLGRFIGLVRAISPFVAGSSRMPLRRFLPYDVLGAGLWGGGLCVLGWVFWRSFNKVATYASRGLFAIGTLIALGGGGIAAYRWLKVPENRARGHTWLHEQAERPLLRPLARVLRPVVWRGVVPAWRRLSGPLRFAGERLTPGDLGLELTTLVAVAAVGGFSFVALDHVTGRGPSPADREAFNVVDRLHQAPLVDAAKVSRPCDPARRRAADPPAARDRGVRARLRSRDDDPRRPQREGGDRPPAPTRAARPYVAVELPLGPRGQRRRLDRARGRAGARGAAPGREGGRPLRRAGARRGHRPDPRRAARALPYGRPGGLGSGRRGVRAVRRCGPPRRLRAAN